MSTKTIKENKTEKGGFGRVNFEGTVHELHDARQLAAWLGGTSTMLVELDGYTDDDGREIPARTMRLTMRTIPDDDEEEGVVEARMRLDEMVHGTTMDDLRDQFPHLYPAQ